MCINGHIHWTFVSLTGAITVMAVSISLLQFIKSYLTIWLHIPLQFGFFLAEEISYFCAQNPQLSLFFSVIAVLVIHYPWFGFSSDCSFGNTLSMVWSLFSGSIDTW